MGHRILIADENSIMRAGVKLILSEEFERIQVAEAENSAQVYRQCHAQEWDLVVLDLNLPGEEGLNVVRKIKQIQPRARVVILTVHLEEQFGTRALRAGADTYLRTKIPVEEFRTAIRKVLGGERYLSPAMTEALVRQSTEQAQPAHRILSDREFQVLRLLGSGKTVGEIAKELQLSVKTVSTYRGRLLQKMSLTNNAELIRYAIRHGLVD